MKTILLTLKKLAIEAGIGLAVISLLAGLALSNASAVYAAAPTATASTAPAPSSTSTAALQKAYQNEQTRLATQSANLAKTDTTVTRIQNLITLAKTKNLDTSALETALSTFQSQVAAAKSAHEAAANILSTHSGFASDGSVTDTAQARQTVLDARQSLQTAATTLGQATKDLVSAVTTWRTDAKGKLQGQALDKAFANEQAWLSRQSANLDKTDTAISKVQALLQAWQAKGIDTTFLQNLLTTFQSQVASAKTAHSSATTILGSHTGFDASGHVTALDQAKQTVLAARQALSNTAATLGQAFKDLSAGLKTWRSEHTPKAVPTVPTPTPTPAPGA